MDIWESNSISQAVTPHPCTITGQHQCDGTTADCGNLPGTRDKGAYGLSFGAVSKIGVVGRGDVGYKYWFICCVLPVTSAGPAVRWTRSVLVPVLITCSFGREHGVSRQL